MRDPRDRDKEVATLIGILIFLVAVLFAVLVAHADSIALSQGEFGPAITPPHYLAVRYVGADDAGGTVDLQCFLADSAGVDFMLAQYQIGDTPIKVVAWNGHPTWGFEFDRLPDPVGVSDYQWATVPIHRYYYPDEAPPNDSLSVQMPASRDTSGVAMFPVGDGPHLICFRRSMSSPWTLPYPTNHLYEIGEGLVDTVFSDTLWWTVRFWTTPPDCEIGRAHV